MSEFLDQLMQFFSDQWPAFILLAYSYMNAKVIRAENAIRVSELQAQIKENHEKVQTMFSGKSDADVVNSVASPGGVQPGTGEKPS